MTETKMKIILCALAAFLAFSVNAAEPADNIGLEVTAGFQDVFKSESWVPVLVRIANQGPTISLRVVLNRTARYSSNFDSRIERLVDVPPRSTKSIQFVIPSDLYENAEIQLYQGDVFLKSADIRGSYAGARDSLILVLSRNYSMDFLTRLREETGSRFGHVQVLYPHVDTIPTDWRGLDCVSLLIVQDVSISLLTRPQIKAIELWVEHGGQVVISGGTHFSSAHESILGPILPVTFEGFMTISAADTLNEFTGTGDAPPAPTIVTRARPVRGDTLLAYQEIPLIVRAGYGLGTVTFLALDFSRPPLSGWNSRSAFWAEIYNPVENKDLSWSRKVRDSTALATSIFQEGPESIIGFIFQGVLFALYIFLLFFIFRLRKGRLTAAAAAGVIFGLIGFFSYSYILQPAASKFSHISITTGTFNGTYGYSENHVFAGVSKAANFSITIPGSEIEFFNEGLIGKTLIEDDKVSIGEISLKRWEWVSAYFESVGRLETDIDVTTVDGRYVVNLKNLSSNRFYDGVFFYNGKLYGTFQVEPFGRISTTIPVENSDDNEDRHLYWEPNIGPGGDTLARLKILNNRLVMPENRFMKADGKLYFVAWVSNPFLTIETSPQFHADKRYALVVLENVS